MSGSVGGGESATDRGEPNLTPILDMVFQLITFFMLVITFKSAALDLSLQLPVVGSAAPADTEGQQDLLVLNINADGHLRVYNRTVSDVKGYIDKEAEVIRLQMRKVNPDVKIGDELPTTIVIRADQGTRFQLLFNVISECQYQGFRRFNYMALNREATK